MAPDQNHICVCICTFKREMLLTRLLKDLQTQITYDLFTYSIVVVDNDHRQSAKSTVKYFRDNFSLSIKYFNEPEQNIALARNKAIENAQGKFLAFIDDDEFPTPTWLLTLYNTYKKFHADGVLGPVKPHFEKTPPEWIIKGKFCERESHQTGTILHWDHTRTGNVLFNKDIFDDRNNWFEHEFGRTGGEDVEFFEKMIKKGRVFVWCNEAPVYETIPPERWKKSFYIKKFLRIGGLTGEKARKWPSWYKYFIKTAISLGLYTALLPFSYLFGQHVFMKCLIKNVYNSGCILGFYGFVVIRNRDDHL